MQHSTVLTNWQVTGMPLLDLICWHCTLCLGKWRHAVRQAGSGTSSQRKKSLAANVAVLP